MDKYIGFDIDCKKTVVCVVQEDKKDLYATIGPDIESMKKFLIGQKKGFSGKTHLVFEVSGQGPFAGRGCMARRGGCPSCRPVPGPPGSAPE